MILRRRAVLMGAVAAVACLTVGAGVIVANRGNADPPPAIPAAAAAMPIETASTPPPVPPAPAQPAVPHAVVAPAAPTGFRVAGAAFDIQATVCGMPFVRPLDPPGDQYHTVCWVQADFGVAPGSASGGTSYILGHSWARAPLVLNQLSELASQEYPGAGPQAENGVPIYPVVGLNGYAITLTTPTGTLVYNVTRSYLVSKNLAGNVDSLMANSPDRVVIITCAVQNGIDLDYNVIVEAQLASSAAAVA
jgi:hypothetical protein